MHNIVFWPLEPCAHSVHAVPGFMGPPHWFLNPQKTENQAVGGFIRNKRGVPPKQKMLIYVLENLGKWAKFNSNFVDHKMVA